MDFESWKADFSGRKLGFSANKVPFQHPYCLLRIGLKLIRALKGWGTKDTRQQMESIWAGKLEEKTATLWHLLAFLFVISSMLSAQTHTTVCGAKAKDFTARIFTSSHTFVFIFINFNTFAGAPSVWTREREEEIFSRDKINLSMACFCIGAD
jgi:hypothetical protein